MFSRYLKYFRRALPLALAAGYSLINQKPLHLATELYVDQPKVKFISDISEYVKNEE